MVITINELRAPFREELDEYRKAFQSILASNVPLIDTIVKYVVKNKGKGLRPLLVIMSAKLLGRPTADTYNMASIVELLHTASLVHDDVVDEANIRRGFPTINAIWKNKVAVLMGDYMLSKCLIGAASTGNIRFLQILSESSRRLSKGELSQIEKSRKLNITETEYFKIISDKTAALISAAAELGALTTSRNIDDHLQLKEFGENLGIAFQIKDDLLDYYGKHNIIGKPVGNDLKDKKITLPLIYSFKKSTTDEIRKIKRNLKKGVNGKDVKEIIKFVYEKGGIEYAEDKRDEYAEKAKECLKMYPESEVRESLFKFVDYTVLRNR